MRIKLKQFLQITFNNDPCLGETTNLMIWSPVHHAWLYHKDWHNLMPIDQKFLLKQSVERIAIRSDKKGYIAIFLKDYGNKGNRKRYAHLRN